MIRWFVRAYRRVRTIAIGIDKRHPPRTGGQIQDESCSKAASTCPVCGVDLDKSISKYPRTEGTRLEKQPS